MLVSADTTTGLVMDPVHGAIPLHEHERRVLQHPLMQRLRFIQQNDLTHFVYPGATQSRFAHSIGTMHVASLCFDAVVRAVIERAPDSAAAGQSGTAAACAYFRNVVRMAALLHDVGHGPFSHAFEQSHAVKALFRDGAIQSALWRGLERKKYIAQEPAAFDHGVYGIRVALEVLQEPGLPFETDDVLSVLEHAVIAPSKAFEDQARTLIAALNVPRITAPAAAAAGQEILRSIICGPVNADTMDWVLRDSYYTGSEYGAFNLDYLVNSLRLGYTLGGNGAVSWAGLAIAEKGLGNLEQFAFARLQLYRHVYQHPTVVGFKVILHHALSEILQDSMTRRHTTRALSDLNRLPTLHDYSVWSRFLDYAAQDKDSACHDLVSRRKVDHLLTLNNPSKPALQAARSKIALGTRKKLFEQEIKLRTSLTEKGADPIPVLAEKVHGFAIEDLPPRPIFTGRDYNARTVNLFAVSSGWAAAPPERPPRGLLICGIGLPCAGKSTILKHFAGKIGARFFREPEEPRWPESVMRRDVMGHFTALTWFRSVRVENLMNAHEARTNGELAVVDSYYDKLIVKYLGKPAVRWLIQPDDKYYRAFQNVAALDYDNLPTADLVIVFKVRHEDWRKFLDLRGRELDAEAEFLQSFKSQQYFINAAKALHKEKGVHYEIFERRFIDSDNPTEDAAESLAQQLAPILRRLSGQRA